MHWFWLRSTIFILLAMLQILIPVKSLKELDLQTFINNAKVGNQKPLLILLYSDKCEPCKAAEDTLESLIAEGAINQVIPEVLVFKEKSAVVTKTFRVTNFPTLVLIRDNATALYSDSFDPEPVFTWLDKATATAATRILTDDTFEHQTQAATGGTTGSWLVVFFSDECDSYLHVAESIGVENRNWLNVAKIDLLKNPRLEKRFGITFCPEVIFFHARKMYRYEPRKYDIPSVTSFITSFYKNMKAENVPAELTFFDTLTEDIAKFIKSQLEGEGRTFFILVSIGLAGTLIAATIFCCLTGGSDSKSKRD